MNEKESIIGKAELIAGFTVVILTVLGVIQVILGEFISKSVALTANGIDCIGDGFVSGIVWIGLKYFRKPADHKFHYGYYKMENLAAIGAAVVMLVLASFIVYRSYLQFVDPHKIEVPIYGAVIALIAALIAWALGIKKYMEGKETKMSSLKLDAYNTIKDGTASFMAVIALMLSAYGYPIADAIVGFVIAGIILSIGFATIKESSYILVDACDAECIDHGFVLSTLVEDLKEVKAAHIVRLRRSGPVLQGEIEIKVSGKMSVAELHELREKIQEMAKKEIPDIERLTVTAIPFKEE